MEDTTTTSTTTPEYTGTLSILDASGDTKVRWHRNSPDQIAYARQTFDEHTRLRGAVAFKTAENGLDGDKIDAFDAEAEQIILVPQYQGG